MQPAINGPLSYKNKKLYFDNIPLENLTKKFATPFYIYSEKVLLDNYNKFNSIAIKEGLPSPLICFALKCNSNSTLLKSLARAGAGADIVSGGELKRALEAGIPPEKIVFSGVGKTKDEILLALKSSKKGIYSFNVESIDELALINEVAKLRKMKARVAFRFNPQVLAKTHKHISTGHKTHKFGLLSLDILGLNKSFSKKYPNIDWVGLSMHIGSQLTCLKATKKALKELWELALTLDRPFEFLDVGGGLGIDYSPEDKKRFSSIEDYMKVLSLSWRNAKSYNHPSPRVVFEPGRVIAARAGVFITKVIRTKESGDCFFAIVDGGMNDFVRTSLYGAYHEVHPLKKSARKSVATDIVGPICETADCFATGRLLPKISKDDFIAVADVGAYGFTMASRYNLRELPKEIIINSKGKIS